MLMTSGHDSSNGGDVPIKPSICRPCGLLLVRVELVLEEGRGDGAEILETEVRGEWTELLDAHTGSGTWTREGS